MRWYAQDEVNQEDSEQNEVDVMKKGVDSTATRKVMHMWERLVICNDEDTNVWEKDKEVGSFLYSIIHYYSSVIVAFY